MYLFPHISRAFSVPKLLPSIGQVTSILRWTALVALITTNIISINQRDTGDWQRRMRIVAHPTDGMSHMELAHAFWSKRRLDSARRELLLAQAYTQKPQASAKVLGATSSSPQELLLQWTSEPNRLSHQQDNWRSIIQQKPDYRDAYIQLAAVAYQLRNGEQVRSSIERARVLDPNNPFLGKLDLLLSQGE